MKPIDYVIIAVVAVAVVGVVAYLIYNKKKGKNVGCGCGCSGCPNAGACSARKDQTSVAEREKTAEENPSEEV